MEALYLKLYDKYTTLKIKKWSELDKLGKDQEVKFVNYVNAAEELIQHLKTENDQLRAQIDDLRNEMSSIRSMKDEQYADHQRTLMEESQKNKALAEELENIRNLQQEGIIGSVKDGGKADAHSDTTGGAQSNSLSGKMARKRHRLSCSESQDDDMHCVSSNAGTNVQQRECCRRIDTSGDAQKESVCANCFFHAFVEYLVGMKVSTVNQSEGMCMSAMHQSSGYSFSLTWVNKASGEEAELVYRVISLGTFERVAPEWMREVIIFSTTMCPIFFERVSRVIKLHS